MRNFNDNRRTGGRNQGRSGGRDQRRTEMHQATCSDCGRNCEVPFRPSGDKPVYCNNCFKKDGDSGSRRPERPGFGKFGKRDFGRSSFEERRMYGATCADCGNRCEVPFRPTGDKPVYCNDCFGESRGNDFGSKKPAIGPVFDPETQTRREGSGPERGQSNEQFEQLNKKLDKILKVLAIISPKREFIIEKPVAETESSDLPVEASAETEEKEEVKPAKKAKKVSKKKAPVKKAKKKTTKKAPAKKKGK